MKLNIKYSLLVVILCVSMMSSHAQVFSDKVVGKKNTEVSDSLKNSEYPYMLPIWGEKVTALGFDLPYSAGLGVNTIWQESDLTIENLFVGFNNGPQYDLNEIVRFNKATSRTNGVNFRPDIWVFPFLNAYGIFAQSTTETDVDFGIWVPNGESSREIFDYGTVAKFNATSVGFGVTPTVGVGGGWFALDMNWTWTDIAELDSPARSFVFGPRLGKTFKLKEPQRNINIWVGGFRLKFKSDTDGSLDLSELVDDASGLGTRVDNALVGIAESQEQLDEWYAGLSPPQQIVNLPKYTAGTAILSGANSVFSGLANGIENLSNSTVQYSLDKGQTNMWNFLIGAQYQHNKHWMIRAEAGILGTRTQVITGLQYRFGL